MEINLLYAVYAQIIVPTVFRKRRVNMQRPISAKRHGWEGNFTSIGVLNLGK